MLDVDLGGACARFTDRAGGVSTGAYASLNLGPWTDDVPEDVAENRRRLADATGAMLAQGHQVHGTTVARVTDRPWPEAAGAAGAGIAGGRPAAADGQATCLEGVAPIVLTADCVPVVVAGAGAVAALHAGWRGLAGGVLAAGVQAVRELGTNGAPLRAAVGPSAGPCCYEVGEEVAARFDARFRRGTGAATHLDLPAAAAAALRDAGVEHVELVGLCTICDERFFSHRRDGGVTGRQAGLGWLT
ncbi:polyphenol oxidase family protein [Conexibacter sp. SYSU D00693]|uniref:polyphenol oxidase family protein n=1 Tax=Conexibacter sp. SYSU D00693 TaxID=2812560 RepID=UPI00196A9E02|nr:polyphenol oxidase family protein [Conexibacter sp. SYSU D00693]